MSNHNRLFPLSFPPEYASSWGDDIFGLWFEIEVSGIIQRMRWIEPGTFWMGSRGRGSGEGPRHLVTINSGYWLADTACTQKLWKRIVGNNPSHFKNNPDCPVEQTSWNDIVYNFLPRLQVMIKNFKVALPTEAQWEYACRAGCEESYFFGKKITRAQANIEGDTTVSVKSYKKNGWGLYQMHGNVWEWCEGSQRRYNIDQINDPADGQDAVWRALRGGSWSSPIDSARSAYRARARCDEGNRATGFRFSFRQIDRNTSAGMSESRGT